MRSHRRRVTPGTAAALLLASLAAVAADDRYDPDAALKRSQAAVGRELGDHPFTDHDGHAVRLSDYAGKPLLISLIYTSCYHTCPQITRHLHQSVRAAREVLDADSFRVVTIGFDSANDKPSALRAFARGQGIDDPGWDFLSGTPDAVAALADELGFVFFPSPRGFDHLAQVTMVDRAGRVYAQVYGATFDLPWLVEPLKELVYDRARTDGHPLDGLIDRVRLFCTVYDPATGRYRIDYSLFIQIAIGLLIVTSVGAYLLRESRRRRAAGTAGD